ncbi:prephenate dehydrogenase [Clostridium oryzae]|uniref:Prephenate dehydrogenase n=1 Tax=Clostridium oryzae TaxID=1450648 RepID=A0A1V4IBU1_9CLOT|nr:prephenate dehydrogenase [Clostridium oryzae]OPJ57399.1 prephenate dehydrogenase [Clostridium oryzae]
MEDLSGFKITVVGLGLIGGSMAKALKKLNPDKLWAFDKDASVLNNAKANNTIDDGFKDNDEVLAASDIVLIALYPKDTAEFIISKMNCFKQNAIITDACGLKQYIFEQVEKNIRKDINFIGGHPMAGKEVSGFKNADENMFVNSSYFLISSNNCTAESLSLLETIVYLIGCKNVIKVSADEHDQIIAYTSHLPHIIAVSLINCCNMDFQLNKISGGSFRDATRVANINSKLWGKLLIENRRNSLTMLDKFIDNLNTMKEYISNQDLVSLNSELDKAASKRKEF